MPTASVRSYILRGIDAVPVTIEAELIRRLPCVVFVGVPAAYSRELGDIIRSAILAAGYDFPRSRVVVSVSPADIRGDVSGLALPVAVAILKASGQVPATFGDGAAIAGGLSLAGDIRPVSRGALAYGATARREGLSLWTGPDDGGRAVYTGATVAPARTLRDLCDGVTAPLPTPETSPPPSLALADIRGQDDALRALADAAATRRPVILIGSPGCGKTMIAARAGLLLPPMSEGEALETATIRDAAGLRGDTDPRTGPRPFRAPHHTISTAGMIGGSACRPGEVNLAHNGVLFLDELPEFPRAVLDTLRAAVDGGQTRYGHGADVARIPARPWIIAAANPCPCGNFGHPARPCFCSPESRERYAARLEHPMFRDAVRINLAPVSAATLLGT